jgi:hypothetical protein
MAQGVFGGRIGERACYGVNVRQQAALDPEIGWIWLARADRWESLVEAEIEAPYRACNSFREEPAAA